MTAIAIAGPSVVAGTDIKAELKKGLTSLVVALTNVGVSIITNRIIAAGTAAKNIGWGTSATAAAVADTALGTEFAPTTAGGRTVGTESRVTVTNANDTYQVTGTVTATTAGTIAEAGLFDAVTAGNMLIHANFTGVAVAISDSIAFTFQTKFVPSAV
jgi:hypothetical protein